MKKHEFYKKYANIPLGSRHIMLGTGNNCKSPWELYSEIKKCDQKIDEEQKEIERLLEIAKLIIK